MEPSLPQAHQALRQQPALPSHLAFHPPPPPPPHTCPTVSIPRLPLLPRAHSGHTHTPPYTDTQCTHSCMYSGTQGTHTFKHEHPEYTQAPWVHRYKVPTRPYRDAWGTHTPCVWTQGYTHIPMWTRKHTCAQTHRAHTYTSAHTCAPVSTHRLCRGTCASACPGHSQAPVNSRSRAPTQPQVSLYTVTPAAQSLEGAGERDREKGRDMYPQVGHPIRCYLSADPTSFQVALQLWDVGCGGVLDLKPLLGR